MPTNNPDPPNAALAGFDDVTVALRAVKNLVRDGGRNASALRTIFSENDASPTATDVALSKAKDSVQRSRPKTSLIAPGI
jgi:hypothetical protein